MPQGDLLEVLVALRQSDDPEIAGAATETLQSENTEDLLNAAGAEDTAPTVLAYLANFTGGARELHEAAILNSKTPDAALATFAASTADPSLLELIAVNQQRLVRFPDIIEAILGNPARSPEAERRARETRREFFEKERGARQIAEELRAQGKTAAAEFFEAAELTTAGGELSLDDAWIIAQHIEVSDTDIDDTWLPAERYGELVETLEQSATNVQRVIETERIDRGEITVERVSLIKRIMLMNARDRMKLGMKGDREARGILIRDSNKVVAAAVINNPRIMELEVESIAAMRTVSDEVLRLISLNRAWMRSYAITHQLVRNPRTPIPTVINMLSRIHTKDLLVLSQNRNISEAVRRQAERIGQARKGV